MRQYDTNCDIVIASASNKGTNMILTSVYFEPNISLSNFKAEVNNLIEKLDPFDKVIISGDFNAICSDFGDNMWD